MPKTPAQIRASCHPAEEGQTYVPEFFYAVLDAMLTAQTFTIDPNSSECSIKILLYIPYLIYQQVLGHSYGFNVPPKSSLEFAKTIKEAYENLAPGDGQKWSVTIRAIRDSDPTLSDLLLIFKVVSA